MIPLSRAPDEDHEEAFLEAACEGVREHIRIHWGMQPGGEMLFLDYLVPFAPGDGRDGVSLWDDSLNVSFGDPGGLCTAYALLCEHLMKGLAWSWWEKQPFVTHGVELDRPASPDIDGVLLAFEKHRFWVIPDLAGQSMDWELVGNGGATRRFSELRREDQRVTWTCTNNLGKIVIDDETWSIHADEWPVLRLMSLSRELHPYESLQGPERVRIDALLARPRCWCSSCLEARRRQPPDPLRPYGEPYL